MKRYCLVAYAGDGLPRKEVYVMANSHKEAMNIAWRLFPEYHEVGAFEE
jgi:hypothetical protein